MKNLKNLRSEFLTEAEANSAMDKIRAYCNHVKISYGSYDSDFYSNEYSEYTDYLGFPEMNSLGFGGLGMNINWTFGSGSYGSSYSMTDKYRHNHYPHYSNSSRATLEADVADEHYEYVKDLLYSLGAVSCV